VKKPPHVDDLPSQETRLAIGVALALALAVVGCASPYGAGSHPPRSAASERAHPSAPATARPQSSPNGWTHYRVQPGDTVAHIAACRGATVRELVRANALYDPNRLVVGWSLRVPTLDFCHGQPARAYATAARMRRPTSQSGPNAGAARAAAQASVAAKARAARLLAEARRQYDAAHFEPALHRAEEATTALARGPRDSTTDRQRARGHLLAGMAAAGLEDRKRAIAEFERAFALDPTAKLAPEDRSPRLVELVEASRAQHRDPDAAVGKL
jgi:hypothetical protein